MKSHPNILQRYCHICPRPLSQNNVRINNKVSSRRVLMCRKQRITEFKDMNECKNHLNHVTMSFTCKAQIRCAGGHYVNFYLYRTRRRFKWETRPEQWCYVMQGVSRDVVLVSSELLVLSALILSCFIFFCQPENRESARRDPEPTPSSNQSRKFVRFINVNFV